MPSPEPFSAPTEVYLLLAISMASFAWLLREREGPRWTRWGRAAWGLLLVQAVLVVLHHSLPNLLALSLHRVALFGWMIITTGLWFESKTGRFRLFK